MRSIYRCRLNLFKWFLSRINMITSPEGKGVFSWGILRSKNGCIECFLGETRFKRKGRPVCFMG